MSEPLDIPLGDLADCFEGVIPSVVATLDADGLPNVTYLSQVYLVDPAHVALSNQFFSKTAANVRATGRAAVVVSSGRTGEQYALDLAFDRSLDHGEVFEKMSAHLRVIATLHGLGEVMALRSAEIYRVLAVRRIPDPPGTAPPPPRPRADPRLSIAAAIAADLAAETDSEAMIERVLSGLTDEFGFEAAMLLTLDEGSGRLAAVASRGYSQGGAGAEVALGDGPIGIAGETGRVVRMSDMSRGRRMAAAVTGEPLANAIPLPGLADPYSQIAVPLIGRGRLQGVLFAESARRFRFETADEAALGLLAGHLAAGLRLAEIDAAETAAAPALPGARIGAGRIFQVKYFAHDDSLFIDGDYLIKGVAGRLLAHVLAAHVRDGRRDFTNREIRLEPSLRLPGLKDNLETRLILLRRRLEEKGAPVRLDRPGRGQIRLELDGVPALEIVDA